MKAIVFGGGKIARGFIGHLLYLSHIPCIFVDINEQLVERLNSSQGYMVNIMGNEAMNCKVEGCRALPLSDTDGIADQWGKAEVAFVSIGGKNLAALGKVLAEAFRIRCDRSEWSKTFNFIVCENWKEPAHVLREAIRDHLSGAYLTQFDCWIGITEAVVMRSGVEPSTDMLQKDPLCLCVSDYWELPVDEARWKGKQLRISGIRYMNDFSGFLERKFYTYNSANATVSYLGYLRKHHDLYDAATDPEIYPILEGVYEETSKALVKKHRIREDDQRNFALSSRSKLQDRSIIDYVERNARDPIRKLGPDDRLIGSASLALKFGVVPYALATAAAAALCYDHPDDPAAQELRLLREQKGIDYALQMICKLNATDPLALLIKKQMQWLRKEGWIA